MQIPLSYREATFQSMRGLVDDVEVWQSVDWIGTRRSAGVQVRIIEAARATNRRKSWSLRAAFAFEASGIVSLALAAMTFA